jgi:hypothetical protein
VRAVPLDSFGAPILDVTMLGRDPNDQEVPRVLFPAKDVEA